MAPVCLPEALPFLLLFGGRLSEVLLTESPGDLSGSHGLYLLLLLLCFSASLVRIPGALRDLGQLTSSSSSFLLLPRRVPAPARPCLTMDKKVLALRKQEPF